MQIKGSPTQQHHARVYGDDYTYDNFVKTFNDASDGADLDALAEVCRGAGARYVVLTTKHHDGFALWPSGTAHPVKGHYHSRRDLVGDLTDAVRDRRMRMGLYYSGGYDWPYNGSAVSRAADTVLAVPRERAYVHYVTAHWRELIDRYQPSVLWNDIAWPRDPEPATALGVLLQPGRRGGGQRPVGAATVPEKPGDRHRGARRLRCRSAPVALIPEDRRLRTFGTPRGAPRHCDVRTVVRTVGLPPRRASGSWSALWGAPSESIETRRAPT